MKGDRLVFVYASLLPAMEAPLAHVCPGGTVFRILVPGSPWRCSRCRWAEYTSTESLVVRELEPETLSILRISRPNILLVDGPEPLAQGPQVLELPRLARRESGGSLEYAAFSSMGLAGPEAVEEARAAGYRAALLEYTATVERPPDLDLVTRTMDKAYETLDAVEILVPVSGAREEKVIVHGLAHRYPEAAIHLLASPGAEEAAYRLAAELRDKRRVNAYPHPEESHTLLDTVCRNCGAILVERRPWGTRVHAKRGETGRARCPSCGSTARLLLCRTPTRRAALHREIVVL